MPLHWPQVPRVTAFVPPKIYSSMSVAHMLPVSERRITERQIIERRITERRITERWITERRKLPDVKYYPTSNITKRTVEYLQNG